MTTTTKPEPKSALSQQQESRADALRVAREVLRASTGAFSSSAPDAIDLVSVASWIVTGEDPWETKQGKDDSG